ncbi:SDR family oxidoreductase [Telluribacter sp. SYSU D00476]|uniref:SDR family oxidoreductase n=1 Tax=Telluribacter sp. SYSU D00476 TaxID=2811430 RepID=UPI001FF5283C|nr:SDR family oxidoreductase [Telluribacter sp. SYSU D00476]
MNNLNGKVALVTGASRGIGAGIAKALAKAGAQVVVNYAGNQAAAEQVVQEIRGQGGEALAVQADVSKPDQVAHLFDQAIAHFGKVDILVNNAGVILYKLIQDTTEEDLTRILDVNVKGVFNTLREAATRLADHGSIINFSTSVTRLMLPTYGAYAASKAAVEQLTRIFAKEMGSRGINVNVVSPGPTRTELFLEGKSEETVARLASLSAFNRIGEPQDIARVVVFLASDEAKWISAQNIGANGAMA